MRGEGLIGRNRRIKDAPAYPARPISIAAAPNPTQVTLAELVRLAPAARELTLWQSARRVEDGGNRFTLFKGRGMEFAETRPYQPGDDIRQIDWRVTARTGRAHTKLYRDERERPVFAWIDCRARMFFATRGMYKSVVAARLAALVAWAAHAHGDRIGGCIAGAANDAVLVPERGRHGVLRLLRALEQAGARDDSRADHGGFDAARSLNGVRHTVRPGTIVFLISDFYGLHGDIAQLLTELGPHCDPTLCFVYDPLEAELPPAGRYPIASIDGRRALLDTGDRALRRRHADRFRARLEELETLARRHRARFISCTTTDDPLLVLKSACGQGNRRRDKA